MRLDIKATSLASAITLVIIYVVAAFFVAVAPVTTITFLSYIAHVDLTVFTKVFDWGNFFIGLIAVSVIGYILGALYACLYNKFVKGKLSS